MKYNKAFIGTDLCFEEGAYDVSESKRGIIESSPQKTDAGKEELYLYSLRKMAEENVENNRTGLTNLHNINSFFYLCG